MAKKTKKEKIACKRVFYLRKLARPRENKKAFDTIKKRTYSKRKKGKKPTILGCFAVGFVRNPREHKGEKRDLRSMYLIKSRKKG